MRKILAAVLLHQMASLEFSSAQALERQGSDCLQGPASGPAAQTTATAEPLERVLARERERERRLAAEAMFIERDGVRKPQRTPELDTSMTRLSLR